MHTIVSLVVRVLSHELCGLAAQALILLVALSDCGTQETLLNFSEPPSPHPSNRDNIRTFLTVFLWGLHAMKYKLLHVILDTQQI